MSKGWRDIQVSQELYDEIIAVEKKIAKTAIPAPEKVQKQKAPKKYYERINCRKGAYKGLTYKRNEWKNTENAEKVQFPAWCTYYTKGKHRQIRFGLINKRYDYNNDVHYQLIDINEQTFRSNYIIEYLSLENLINDYYITIGEAKLIFKEGEDD